MSKASPTFADSAPPLGFAARLREETKLVHREAERSGFISELIRGRATRPGYVLFLRNLVPIYAALEEGLNKHSGAFFAAAFSQPGLARLPSLTADIEALEIASPSVRMLAETGAYAKAIRAAADGDGSRLMAHAYARYLGDLSGGQILKPILARSLDLTPETLRFYDFPMISDPELAKAKMREALDRVPPASDRADLIVDEAVAAFRHNIAVSVAVVRALENVN